MNVAMESEILYIKDYPCPHQVVSIPGDGSSLFHSLSFSIYGNIESSYDISCAIVEHVVAHWNEMQQYNNQTLTNKIQDRSEAGRRQRSSMVLFIDLCALDENVIVQLTTMYENFVNKIAVRYYALTEQGKPIQILIYINNLNRIFLTYERFQEICINYQLQSISNLKDIDASLEKSDVEKIKKYGKQQNISSIVMKSEESREILEDALIDKHKAALKSLKL
ncbi:unnamed protein product, partial [Brenthis ino]